MDGQQSDKISMRSLWPAGVALALVCAVYAISLSYSPLSRLSNLDVREGGFPNVYITLSKTEPNRGYVGDRRDSTIRRNDRKQPGRKWNLRNIPDVSGRSERDIWFTQSKRKGKGTLFYIPVEQISDWTYPFFYRFVRRHDPQLELPKVSWVQLYVNRIYAGFHLRVAMPFDKRKKDGGSGVLRQLLIVEDGQLTHLDTRFNDKRGVYTDAVAKGIFPELHPPSATLAWLARRSPIRGTTFLMPNQAPYEVRLLPLPIPLLALFQADRGYQPAGFRDERLERWTLANWRNEANDKVISPEFWKEMRAEFPAYASAFRSALRLEGQLHHSAEDLKRALPRRQLATAGLGLNLGRL